MKKPRNQIQNGKETSSHYTIRSEGYLCWLFAFFGVCSTGLLIYSIIIKEALWAILFLLLISMVMATAAFNIGLWKVEVNDMEIMYRSTFGSVRKYYFGDITKGVYKKSGAFRVYIGEKRIFTFDDNMDNSLFIEQMNRLHIPVWSYSFFLKMKKKSVFFIVCIIMAVSITAMISILLGHKGNTANVNCVIGTSTLYEEEQINKAFDAVENKFVDEMQRYQTLYNRELMIVLSDFVTDRSAGDLGMIPNETYTDWSWSLVRVEDPQGWEVVEGGWGY